MQLYILRHGEAERFSASDRQRQLTARGRDEVKAVVHRHKHELSEVETIFASPYDRAQQTAGVVSQTFPSIPLQTLDIITPDHSPNDVLKFLCQQHDSSTFLLVSHQPLVSELVAELCDVPTQSISMPTAALASIVLDPIGRGMGQLQFID